MEAWTGTCGGPAAATPVRELQRVVRNRTLDLVSIFIECTKEAVTCELATAHPVLKIYC